MKRNNYRLNGLFKQDVEFGTLTPSFMQEVAPGETMSGEVEHRFMSGPTSAALMNRLFVDTYHFYVPWRLVWKEFPNFLTQRNTGIDGEDGTPPLIVPQYNMDVTGSDYTSRDAMGEIMWLKNAQQETTWNTAPTWTVNALPIWAYVLIWNTFFRRTDQDVVDYQDRSHFPLQVNYRGSDYHSRLLSQIAIQDTSLSSVSTVDEMRQAFAEDRFNKIRSFYGDKYTDYLRSVGVQARWSVLEDPEYLGKCSTELKFSLTRNEALAEDAPLGAKSGFYHGQSNFKLGKKFFTEHGLVIGLHAVRMEAPVSSSNHPVFANYQPDHFWSPEYDSRSVAEYSKQRFLSTNNTSTVDAPPFMDLISGLHLSNVSPSGQLAVDGYYATRKGAPGSATDPLTSAYLDTTTIDFNGIFESEAGDPSLPNSLASLAVTKLTKGSPVAATQRPIY